MSDKIYVARAALHAWEEPCISGNRGSGTIFFGGCSLKCIFCQNRNISRGRAGKEIGVERLAEIMIELEEKGAHNINLVTPTHFAPSVKEAVSLSRSRGMSLPIVYNTSSYDTAETLRALCGTVDIYLADFKYFTEKSARELSMAPNYPKTARDTIGEMVAQTGTPTFDEHGIMLRGTVVRVLLLPAHVAEAKLTVKYLYDTFGDSIIISLMNQYTPIGSLPAPLDRRVTREEYRQLTEYADRIGVRHAYVQDRESASESFIPEFDCEGV